MGLGVGVFLLLIGAILAFAVTGDVSGLDINAVGWISMLVGLVAIGLSLMLARQRANTSHTEVVERRDYGSTPTDYGTTPRL
ncbi:MAG: DUF6458 family protein [Kineosporiaceae bacterium]